MRRYYIIEDNFDVKFRTLAEVKDFLDNLSFDDLCNFKGSSIHRIYESNGIATYDDNFVRYINIYQTSKSYWLSDVKLSNG